MVSDPPPPLPGDAELLSKTLGPISGLIGCLGWSTMASPTTLHIGRPRGGGGGAALEGGGEGGWTQGCMGRGGEVAAPLQGAQPTPSHCLSDGKCQLQWHL